MIDIKTLLPEVQKLLPGVSPQEIMAGIKEFMKAHPNSTNQQALQALTMYLQQQKQAPPAQAPQAPAGAPPFQNLLSQLGGK